MKVVCVTEKEVSLFGYNISNEAIPYFCWNKTSRIDEFCKISFASCIVLTKDFHLSQKLERELPAYDKRYHELEKDFGELYGERDIAEDQQEAIGARMDRIRSRWNSLHKVRDTQKQR